MKKLHNFVQTSGRKSRIILCIALAMLLALCLVFAFALLKKEEPLTASAAELDTVTQTDTISEDYITANLLYYPYNEEVVDYNWYTLAFIDGKIDFKLKYNPSPGNRLFAGVGTFLLSAGTYTLSGSYYVSSTLYVGLSLDYGDARVDVINAPVTFTLTADENVSFFLVTPVELNTVSVILSPVLNKGITAYSFIPNLQSIYDYANNTGHDAGYQEGLTEGNDEAKKGVFNGTTFDIKYSYDGTNYLTKKNLIPNFANGGIYFKDIYDEIGVGLDNCTLCIHTKPFIYDVTIQNFFGLGFGLNTPTFITEDGRRYASDIVNYSYMNGYLYEIKDGGNVLNVLNSPVIEIEMFLGRANDTLYEWKLCSTGGSFNAGFTNGYNEGKEDGFTSGFGQGKTEGLTEGEKIGYDEGYNVGYSVGFDAAPKHQYSFTNLLTSVIDVPVSVVLKMMDFEILGINLSALLLSLLSVALLIALIKKFS